MKQIFSTSDIWQWQRDYFTDAGIDAWRNQQVPHYVTSNPFISKVYAEMIIAFLRDLAAKEKTNETVYILELGAGHGRFSYHVLKYLEKLTEEIGGSLPSFCYILSDLSESNIQYWKAHPRLQPYLQKGWLDLAIVDATDLENIFLQISGKKISTGSLQQPLIAIANYFFDTIPQELFYIDDQKIFQCLVETKANEISGMELIYSTGEEVLQPYHEEYLTSILDSYRETLSQTHLLFPDTGIRCLHKLRSFSKNGLFLLTADKGYHRKEEAQNTSVPEIVLHGSFSLPVNYHAIKTYCVNAGGMALFPTQSDFDLTVGALLVLNNAGAYRETALAYNRFVNEFGPDDFFSLKKMFNHVADSMSLRDMMAALRLSGYDARYFEQIMPKIFDLCKEVSEKERWLLFQTVHRVWEMYYPLGGEAHDPATDLGEILYRLKFYTEAIIYFKISDQIYGERSSTLYNIALCYFYGNSRDEAARIIRLALDKDPSHLPSKQLAEMINRF